MKLRDAIRLASKKPGWQVCKKNNTGEWKIILPGRIILLNSRKKEAPRILLRELKRCDDT